MGIPNGTSAKALREWLADIPDDATVSVGHSTRDRNEGVDYKIYANWGDLPRRNLFVRDTGV